MAVIPAVMVRDAWVVRDGKGEEQTFDATIKVEDGLVMMSGPGGDRSVTLDRDEWGAVVAMVATEYKRLDAMPAMARLEAQAGES